MPHTFSQFARRITQQYNLKPVDVYFLDLIPLIEMIWADGKRQRSEINVLLNYVDEMTIRFASLDLSDTISREDITDFINRYIQERPDPKLLSELRKEAIKLANLRSDDTHKISIISYCMDIATSSFGGNDVSEEQASQLANEEKLLLIKIMSALKISTTTTIDIS